MARTKMLWGLFALLLLAGLASAGMWDLLQTMSLSTWNAFFHGTSCDTVGGIDHTQAVLFACVALLVSYLLTGLFYMVGNFLNAPNLSSWAKNELYQTTATLVLVILLVGMVLALDSTFMLQLTASSPPKPMIDNAIDYSRTMRNTLTLDFMGFTVGNVVVSLLASLNLTVTPGRYAGISFSTGPIFRPLADALGLGLQTMMLALGEWVGNELFLCFIKRFMLTVFLPLGIIFRAFSFTRKAGGALLAITLGLYFVYPAMLFLNFQIVNAHYHYEFDTTNFFFSSPIQDTTRYFAETSLLGGFGLFVAGVGLLSQSVLTALLFGTFLPYIYFAFNEVIYCVIIISIALPLINILITLTFIKEIASLLEVDINLSALSKLI